MAGVPVLVAEVRAQGDSFLPLLHLSQECLSKFLLAVAEQSLPLAILLLLIQMRLSQMVVDEMVGPEALAGEGLLEIVEVVIAMVLVMVVQVLQAKEIMEEPLIPLMDVMVAEEEQGEGVVVWDQEGGITWRFVRQVRSESCQ